MRKFNLNFWLVEYEKLRKGQGDDYFRADELREMLRRMGFEIRNTPQRPRVIEHYSIEREDD